MGQGVLHTAAEHMGPVAVGVVLRQLHRLLCRNEAPLPFQGADLDAGTAQGLTQLLKINGVAVFPHQIDHVHRQHHRMAQIHQLGTQVEVALNVGAVHDVKYRVGVILHQIGAGHQLLRRVGGQGVDAGQILDHHLRVALQGALLLLHRDPGPVAYILVGAG